MMRPQAARAHAAPQMAGAPQNLTRPSAARAPLVLVSEQRVDYRENRGGPTGPVRPRPCPHQPIRRGDRG